MVGHLLTLPDFSASWFQYLTISQFHVITLTLIHQPFGVWLCCFRYLQKSMKISDCLFLMWWILGYLQNYRNNSDMVSHFSWFLYVTILWFHDFKISQTLTSKQFFVWWKSLIFVQIHGKICDLAGHNSHFPDFSNSQFNDFIILHNHTDL